MTKRYIDFFNTKKTLKLKIPSPMVETSYSRVICEKFWFLPKIPLLMKNVLVYPAGNLAHTSKSYPNIRS